MILPVYLEFAEFSERNFGGMRSRRSPKLQIKKSHIRKSMQDFLLKLEKITSESARCSGDSFCQS